MTENPSGSRGNGLSAAPSGRRWLVTLVLPHDMQRVVYAYGANLVQASYNALAEHLDAKGAIVHGLVDEPAACYYCGQPGGVRATREDLDVHTGTVTDRAVCADCGARFEADHFNVRELLRLPRP